MRRSTYLFGRPDATPELEQARSYIKEDCCYGHLPQLQLEFNICDGI